MLNWIVKKKTDHLTVCKQMTDVKLNYWCWVAVLVITSLCANKWLIHPICWSCKIPWLDLWGRLRTPQWGHLLAVGGDSWCFKTGSWWVSSLWSSCLSSHMISITPLWPFLGLTGSQRNLIQSTGRPLQVFSWRLVKECCKFPYQKVVVVGSIMLKKDLCFPFYYLVSCHLRNENLVILHCWSLLTVWVYWMCCPDLLRHWHFPFWSWRPIKNKPNNNKPQASILSLPNPTIHHQKSWITMKSHHRS